MSTKSKKVDEDAELLRFVEERIETKAKAVLTQVLPALVTDVDVMVAAGLGCDVKNLIQNVLMKEIDNTFKED